MTKNEAIVVVGAGQAGSWAARTLRDEGHMGPILLVGGEPHHPYERPPLSKSVLSGTADLDSCNLLGSEQIALRQIDFRPKVWATSIDAQSRTVTLSDGQTQAYKKLILCTGGHSRVFRIDELEHPAVRTLRTIDDATALKAELAGGSRRLVIIGGGWIGLEVAATARDLGHSVSVLEVADRLCARSVPVEVSEELRSRHAASKVKILTGVAITKIEAAEQEAASIQLDDGTTLSADVVLAGIGLVPNDRLASEAGVACDNGVLVDAACRTSMPDILAAGDVAALQSLRRGRTLRLESWQNAQDQGIAAAKSALGQPVSYDPVPTIWSEQFGALIQIFGWADAVEQVGVRQDGARFMVLGVDRDRRAIFAAAFDGGRDARILGKWVSSGTRVSLAKFKDGSQSLGAVPTLETPSSS